MDDKSKNEASMIVGAIEARDFVRRRKLCRELSDTEKHLANAEQERMLPHVSGPYVTKPGFCGSYRFRHKDTKEVSREVLLKKPADAEKSE